MKKIKYISLLLTFIVLLGACESTDLDLQDDPTQLSPESANPDYILNSINVALNNQVLTLTGLTAPVVRHINQFGTYTNPINGIKQSSMENPWNQNYVILNNLKVLKSISNDENLPHHVAMAEISSAFSIINLVDYLGVAIYSQAVNPDEYPNPGLDDGETIYNSVYDVLDDAISRLHESASYTPDDIFYNGDLQKWEKLANSLKIKMLVQTRKAVSFNNGDAAQVINDILASGMYLQNHNEDFQFRYGTNEISPDSRHPGYISNYVGAPSDYMSNDFMARLVNGLNTNDPRLRAFIYRQTSNAPGVFIDDCINAGFGTSVCYIGNGYWGRLHADESGVPNDNLLRSTLGSYPVGGAYDEDQFLSVSGVPNKKGAGINPILTASNIKFLLAEAALTIPGVNGNHRDYFIAGMQDSFDKVASFVERSLDDVPDYLNLEISNYDTAATDEDKLKLIVNQNYIASFGNGIEPYNAYRRTGYPEFILPNFQDPGPFPRSMFLPKSELDSNDNPNLVQKALTDQVFWDTNPAGFID
jgi:hypothetical protein